MVLLLSWDLQYEDQDFLHSVATYSLDSKARYATVNKLIVHVNSQDSREVAPVGHMYSVQRSFHISVGALQLN